jgi:hypothetical protein
VLAGRVEVGGKLFTIVALEHQREQGKPNAATLFLRKRAHELKVVMPLGRVMLGLGAKDLFHEGRVLAEQPSNEVTGTIVLAGNVGFAPGVRRQPRRR